jgi:hypothetical protein
LTPHADAIGVRIALASDTYLPQVNGVTTVVHRIAQAIRAAGIHDSLSSQGVSYR